MRRNYQDDFTFRLPLLADSAPLDPLSIDWQLDIAVGSLPSEARSRVYSAWSRNGELHNCIISDDGIAVIICQNHRLPPGRLVMELRVWRKDDRYLSGEELNVTPQYPDIELVTGAGDQPTVADVEVVMPIIYRDAYALAVAAGYPGTYDDYVNVILARGTGKITLVGTAGLEMSFDMFNYREKSSYYYYDGGDAEGFIIGEFDEI